MFILTQNNSIITTNKNKYFKKKSKYQELDQSRRTGGGGWRAYIGGIEKLRQLWSYVCFRSDLFFLNENYMAGNIIVARFT